jgi:hypothetical protein
MNTLVIALVVVGVLAAIGVAVGAYLWGKHSGKSATSDALQSTLDKVQEEHAHAFDAPLDHAASEPVPGGLLDALDVADAARAKIDGRAKS